MNALGKEEKGMGERTETANGEWRYKARGRQRGTQFA